ncbi:putative glycoside hydrolase [Salinicoccus sesuvii]|uniref:Glycoside hydrolase n=1 Tax=Salinicoccus sesuvii TaxID=868281 RepID=A0ABV7N673_9STAP
MRMRMIGMGIALIFSSLFITTESEAAETSVLDLHEAPILSVPEAFPEQFKYDSGFDIAYPESGVKGIYVSGYSAGGAKMQDLTELLSNTPLNAMVIDVKEDEGYMMMDLDSEDETIQSLSYEYVDPESLMNHMEQEEIYPIARVVVFKDSQLAEAKPELSFTDENGDVWKNGRGESFVNPFSKDVWDYNVEVAKQAAKLGFKEIQFDYVRFPEGFENRADTLQYTMGEYKSADMDPVQKRVAAVTDFVEYANEALEPYNVDVSVDIFGYAATLPEAPGIGQNFSEISSNVDVISSMIYPSHWGDGYFEIAKPDLEPYETISEYIKVENDVLAELEEAPVSRPWLQDFTASYLGAGNYKEYGVAEIEAQVQALYDNGVEEFLLWDASNNYTRGVDYTDSGSGQ